MKKKGMDLASFLSIFVAIPLSILGILMANSAIFGGQTLGGILIFSCLAFNVAVNIMRSANLKQALSEEEFWKQKRLEFDASTKAYDEERAEREKEHRQTNAEYAIRRAFASGFPDDAEEAKRVYEQAKVFSFETAKANEDLRAEIKSLKEAMELADTPYLATADIRKRISNQAEKADRLHDAAVTRTVMFQYTGLTIIGFGLVIVLTGAIRVFFFDLKPDRLMTVAPIVGVVFNLVGGGLIAFHKTASNTALQYYDRKQGLDDVLTSLELATNKVMRTKVVDIMDSLIRSLFPSSGRPRAPIEAEAEKSVEKKA